MTRKFVILDSAKEDFKEIKSYVKKEFGKPTWNTANKEYKVAFDIIEKKPEHGTRIVELQQLGITNIKYRLVRQTRVVYEFDDSAIYVRMFISTKMDFRTHLLKRLFS